MLDCMKKWINYSNNRGLFSWGQAGLVTLSSQVLSHNGTGHLAEILHSSNTIALLSKNKVKHFASKHTSVYFSTFCPCTALQDRTLQHSTETWTLSGWIMDGVSLPQGCRVMSWLRHSWGRRGGREEGRCGVRRCSRQREGNEKPACREDREDNNHASLLEAALFSDAPASRLLQTQQYK